MPGFRPAALSQLTDGRNKFQFRADAPSIMLQDMAKLKGVKLPIRIGASVGGLWRYALSGPKLPPSGHVGRYNN